MKQNCIAVLGMIDGVHIGHQALLRYAVGLKQKTGLSVKAVTFETHPKAVFGRPPEPLTDCEQKEKLCKDYGADEVVFLPFDETIRHLSPEAFLYDYIIGQIQAKDVVIGSNYRFGYRQAGSAQTLKQCPILSTHVISSVCQNGEMVSSSRIRRLLREGNLTQALDCLGHSLEVTGTVEHGRSVGRKLGFCTANMTGIFPPLCYGVYLTEIGIEQKWYPAISNFGILPTFLKDGAPRLESHLLRFNGDLYHKKIKVRFLDMLRRERKFESSEQLSKQVQNDILEAERYFFK